MSAASQLGVTWRAAKPAAHEDDILITSYWNAQAWKNADLHFDATQIYSSLTGPEHIEGRRFRRAYYTDQAFYLGSPEFWEALHRSSRMMQHPATDSPSDWGHILRVEHFFERETNEPSAP